jgi:hypothetical protein
MAAHTQAESNVERLIAQVLSNARTRGAHQIAARKKPDDDLHRLVRHDYVRSLRRNLGYRGVKELVDAFDQIFPDFNSQPIGMMSVDAFAGMAAQMRFHFKAARYRGDEGLALRGFYVTHTRGMLKRPLIYVNTAHHPLAVSTTFCHELGHHVCSELFGLTQQAVHFFFDADYAAHLGEPGELAADVMVSLAGYPAPTARKIFATPWDWGLVASAQEADQARPR